MAYKLLSIEYMQKETFPFSIYREIHDQGNVPPLHGHEFIELVYVVSGKAKHVFEQELYDIQEGEVFMINPGEMHTYSIEPDNRLEIINCLFMPNLIQDTCLRKLGITQSMDFFYVHPFLDPEERFNHRLHLNSRETYRIYPILEGMMHEFGMRSSAYSTLIRLQLIELLILLSRIYQEKPSGINDPVHQHTDYKLLTRRVCGYLERHFDQKVSISMLAKLFNISSRHLNRVFKQETGRTVIEMLHHIRVDKAKHLLMHTDEKVITIAMKMGYEDPAFFSRLFSRLEGQSPAKFREKNDRTLANEEELEENLYSSVKELIK